MKTMMMANGLPWVVQAHQKANREGRTGRWTKKTMVMTMITVMTWHKNGITKVWQCSNMPVSLENIVSCDEPEEAALLQRQKMFQVLSVKLAQQHLLLRNKWSRLKQNLSRQIGNHFTAKSFTTPNPFIQKKCEACFPPSSPFKKIFLITHCIVWSNLVACILFSPRTIPHLFLTLLQAKPFQHSGSSTIVLKEVWDCSLFDATIFGGVKIQDPICAIWQIFCTGNGINEQSNKGTGYAWPSSNCWPGSVYFTFILHKHLSSQLSFKIDKGLREVYYTNTQTEIGVNCKRYSTAMSAAQCSWNSMVFSRFHFFIEMFLAHSITLYINIW